MQYLPLNHCVFFGDCTLGWYNIIRERNEDGIWNNEMQGSIGRSESLVTAFPCRLVEITYPWNTYGPRARMNLWLMLDNYVRECLPADFHSQDSKLTYEEYERKLAQYLFPEATERERRSHLSEHCPATEVADFVARLTRQLEARLGERIPIVGLQLVKEELGERWCWEVEIDQYAWLEDNAPLYKDWYAKSIDRDNGRLLLMKMAGWRDIRHIPILKVRQDFIELPLNVDVHRKTYLDQKHTQLERLNQQYRELDNERSKLLTSEHPDKSDLETIDSELGKVLRQRMELEEECYPIENDYSHKKFEKCEPRQKEYINHFVEQYGFPFIPYEYDTTHPHGAYYYDAFKTYHREFLAIYHKWKIGKQYTGYDIMALMRWVHGEPSLELQVSQVINPEVSTRATALSERPTCSFVALARMLARANKLVRDQDTGKLMDMFTTCAYCGRIIRDLPKAKYSQFPHCSDKVCHDQYESAIRQYRLETEPGYRQKIREQARKRQAKRRNKLKSSEIPN